MSPSTADQEVSPHSVTAIAKDLVEAVGPGGYWLVLGAGVALMFGSELVLFLYGSPIAIIQFLELVLPMAVGIGLVWYGFQLRDHEFSSWQIAVLGLAVLFGMGLFVVLAAYMSVLLRLEHSVPHESIYLLLNAMALGAALNFVYAYQYIKVKSRAKHLENRVDRLVTILSRASHDLKNPLNVAQGYAELLEDERDDSDRVAPLQDALARIHSLIDELVVFAHSNHSTERRESMSLESVTTDSWAMVETNAGVLTIESDCRFAADPDRVQHLFENLFRNASEHGDPEPTVTVGELESGDGFYVSDDGPGIPKSDREAVFEAGYTTAADGTGLGLNIVAEICEVHDWSIAVEESSSGGTRFEITGTTNKAA
ncbi:sensor histidine kinase [Halodesulfurarchaeum sp.]|uniref:sensor histidine kinase n=1 Tax=Halodesulfurarchaeum sp. TaxID=1980530 RepID=UPI001BBD784B|nr:HAMP domain-containing histidine kinase [Halodesulfurarchaeum sp.]